MIPIREMKPTEVIFTHIDDDGVQTDVAVDRLNEACKLMRDIGRIQPYQINVDRDHAAYYRTHRGIEQHRVDRLTEEAILNNPLIFGQWGDGSHLCLDGHHRYVKAADLGLKSILAFIVPEPAWRLYTVEGHVKATREVLSSMFSGIK